MADAVTTQIITESSGKIVVKFTNISDGTGEAAVAKVDVSALTPAASGVTIERIQWWTSGMGVDFLWDATIDVLIFRVPTNSIGDFVFSPPIQNNAGAGVTGDVLFTTVGHTAGDSYTIILTLRKNN